MALETISQILSPENATYINGVSAERRISPAVLKNIYQGLVEKNGQGINDSFVSEDDAMSSAQVFVNRILPVRMNPREMGANKNGASFSANEHYVQTETVGIEILQVLDDPIIIPRARQDMIKTDLLAEQIEIYSNRMKTILNGATFGSKVLASYLDKANGKAINEHTITAADISNKEVLNRFIEANSKLDEGDQDHGIDIFPMDSRIAVFKVSYRATLKTSGVLVVGGANAAYEIVKGEGLSAGATKREDGYVGEIDGVPCHMISNESLGHASMFCGFPVGEFKSNQLIGYISSSYANARGVSTQKMTKIVDAQAGQGIILQPYSKFGVAVWYPLGNVMLSSKAYDPIAGLKAVFSAVANQLTFKIKGAGSRLFPDLAVTTTRTAVTATSSANDDWNTDHLKGLAYVVTDGAIGTVAGFLDAYNAANSVKGTALTSGQASNYSAQQAQGKVVTVMAIADDGSVTLQSKTIL